MTPRAFDRLCTGGAAVLRSHGATAVSLATVRRTFDDAPQVSLA